jgi:hypothetical protein
MRLFGKDENSFVVFKDAEENCSCLDVVKLARERRINLTLSCSVQGQISSVLRETRLPHPTEALYVSFISTNKVSCLSDVPQFHVFPRYRIVCKYFSTASALVPISPQVTRYNGISASSATPVDHIQQTVKKIIT